MHRTLPALLPRTPANHGAPDRRWSARPIVLALLLGALTACSSKKSAEPRSIVQPPPLAEEDLLEKAIDTYDSGLYTLSSESWMQLRDGYPGTYFSALADLKIADSQFSAGNYADAITAYEDFARVHPGHEAMPYVRFQIGNCYFEQYNGPKRDQAPVYNAIRIFKEVAASYPNSLYGIFARRRLQQCRERLAEYEGQVARFYERQGVERAAERRQRDRALNFPEAPSTTMISEQKDITEQSESRAQSSNGEMASESTVDQKQSEDASRPRSPFQVQRGVPQIPQIVAVPPKQPLQLSRNFGASEAQVRETLQTPSPTQRPNESGSPKNLAPSGTPNQAAASNEEYTDLEGELVAVQCDQSDFGDVFLAAVRHEPKLIATKATSNGGTQYLFRVKKSGPLQSGQHLCHGKNGSLIGEEREGSEGDSVELLFEIATTAKVQPTVLTLDRPHRIVFVLPSPSTTGEE